MFPAYLSDSGMTSEGAISEQKVRPQSVTTETAGQGTLLILKGDI